MAYHRPCRSVSSTSSSFTMNKAIAKQIAIVAGFFVALTCLAQDNNPSQSDQSTSQPTEQAQLRPTVTIPAGTNLALVLTQPVQSRYIHRGDDIYAQITSPVASGNEVVIPAGTFVDGKVDKLERHRGHGELRLQSMSITFPDGYVTPIAGPMTLETSDGYVLKDPGSSRFVGAVAIPAAGFGLGALIGHSIGSSPSTITNTLPPGCTGPPPGCLTSSVTGPSNAGMHTAIGAGIGGAIGMVASLALLSSSHHFFIDVGAPVEMTLQRPVSLQQDEVAQAVQQSEQQPVAEQPIARRPVPPLPPNTPVDHGTCWTPGTPGTPPTVIPGIPGPDGVPGPPTMIPGTPPTPGTPHPCP
jgi:hypothetical protein